MAERATLSDAWAAEERLKEQVYRRLEADLDRMRLEVQSTETYLRSGAYEEQDAFTAHGAFASARKQELKKKQEYAAIFSDPYFTHMEVRPDDDAPLQFLLSDLPELEHPIQIGPSSFIMPFKQSSEAPMLSALFDQYSRKQGGEFEVSVRGRVTTYRSELLRDVEISNRELKNVVQFFPELEDEVRVDADEMLEKRLAENRSSPQLRNIIKTLQSSQFQIVRAPIDDSFVAQGCAGSGKTQCLIHRLFFLRAELDERGWRKVLLITPTQLFRNYSRDLMKRYRLTDVADLSLAELYRDLLSDFDPRFKNRQYRFELTEEFLPDGYLRRVYDEREIRKIEAEIDRAIDSYVSEALRLLNITERPERIDAPLAEELVRRLEAEIRDFDEREALLSDNAEYHEHLDALESAEKEIASLTRRRETLEQAADRLERETSEYERLKQEIDLAESELKTWRDQRDRGLEELRKRYAETLKQTSSAERTSMAGWNAYRRALFSMLDASEPFGKKYSRDQETEAILEQILRLSLQDMEGFTGDRTARNWLRRFSERKRHNAEQLRNVNDRLRELEESTELHGGWLRAFGEEHESASDHRHEYRARLERARFYLGRLESSVFEQEVWNALSPLKEQCGIQTLSIETAEDGRQKQTRILYKSDLLFYLKIYLRLHRTEGLPEYRMICIDEGQDLHSADYQMLGTLFPGAAMNVFGDTAQTLHEACGIRDWKRETGIRREYVLDTNYRNTPAVVEFCNQTFGQAMKSIGTSRDRDRPWICRDLQALRKAVEDPGSVVIVKDRAAFDALCLELGTAPEEFSFLDTTSETAETGKTACYSVFAAKGLEFPRVLVYAKGMTRNQKTVACTRAMQRLYYCDR